MKKILKLEHTHQRNVTFQASVPFALPVEALFSSLVHLTAPCTC